MVSFQIRFGIPDLKLYGLEDMFYKYGVDLQFYAHEHNYERLWPVYQEKVGQNIKNTQNTIRYS